jgi:hypothetical protein
VPLKIANLCMSPGRAGSRPHPVTQSDNPSIDLIGMERHVRVQLKAPRSGGDWLVTSPGAGVRSALCQVPGSADYGSLGDPPAHRASGYAPTGSPNSYSTVTCPARTAVTIERSEQVIPRSSCPSIDLHPEDVRT